MTIAPAKEKIYSEDQLEIIRCGSIPTHIAIIMDGNRRWAKRNNLLSVAGHAKGISVVERIVSTATELGVKTLTLYAFSTENWNRSKEEVEALMELFKIYLIQQRPQMIREGVRLHSIGRTSGLPQDVQETLEDCKKATAGGSNIDLVLALNYGGRDEIRRAVVGIVADVQNGQLRKEDISEYLLGSYLDTAKWEDPQLFIRTSGEMRISNFLLWQLSYAELYICDVLWPDFS